MYCLPKPLASKIKQAIVSGKLSPDKMNKMTSAERRTFLSEMIGKEDAKEVNLLFEKKLLLKNQERGMYDWAREITGISKEAKEATLVKIRQTYADKKRRLYDPQENEAFLNEITSDVYSKKFRTDVSLEEAQIITELSADIQTNKAKMNEDFTWDSKKDGLEFGASKVAFDNYVGGLKTEARKRPLVNPLTQKKGGRTVAVAENAAISVNFIADNSRALLATFDNSFWGRQGIKVMWNPKYTDLWAKNFAKSFVDIAKTLGGGNKAGDAVLDAAKAEIYSRKNYLNERYTTSGKKGAKLDIGGIEEEFPTSLPSKIPVLGRGFRAAEVAYGAGAMRLRADVADRLYTLAEKTGVDLANKDIVGDINLLTNSMTGRGGLGKLESIAPVLNKAFFSIKFAKSNIDVLIAPAKLAADPHSFAKQQAAKNLLNIVATMGIYMGIRKILNPDAVELDPRSSAWGKTREGDTYTDITGGLGPYVTLAARIAAQSTKSSVTGKVTKLGEGYGSSVATDLFWNIAKSKASPLTRQVMEIMDQETFAGDKPSIGSIITGLTVPIIIQEGVKSSQNEQAANLLQILILEGLGLSANTYSINTNWDQNPSEEIKRFKEKVGEKKFEQANDEFNKNMRTWFAKKQKTTEYKNLSNEDKGKTITRQRRIEKAKMFKKYWK